MMSPQLEDIVRKVRSDERIAPAEALVLCTKLRFGCWASWPPGARSA